MTNNKLFIDTNILIYATTKQSPFHMKALQAIKNYMQNGSDLWISTQVIREYLVVLSRQIFPNPLSIYQLSQDIQYFHKNFYIADDNQKITQELLQLIIAHSVTGKQIHDANIVATMIANNITHIFTHNVKDFSRYSKKINIIPL